MTTSQQLGAQLKDARSRAGLSLRKLGALTKIPATTIEGYEAGNKIPADKFLLLADALKHRIFRVDGNEFTVSRADASIVPTVGGEQLNLDFLGEYTYSKASIKISPGKIAVSFDGVKIYAES